MSSQAKNAVPDVSLVDDADIGNAGKKAVDTVGDATSDAASSAKDAAKDASSKVLHPCRLASPYPIVWPCHVVSSSLGTASSKEATG